MAKKTRPQMQPEGPVKYYRAGDVEFTSYLRAVDHAHAHGLDVIEIATGMRRWHPAHKKSTSQVRHVIIESNGAETEFSRVRK